MSTHTITAPEAQQQPLLQLLNGALLSYSQVLFSGSRGLGVLLVLATFMDTIAGAAGLFAVLVAQSIAYFLGVDRKLLGSGVLGYNSLLLGLCLGHYYEFTWQFGVVLALSSAFALLLSVWLLGVLSRSQLPFLSLPLMLAFWAVLLAKGDFGVLNLSERGIYTLNEMYQRGGQTLLSLHQSLEGLPTAMLIYFKSLGAIFFEHTALTGMLVAVGLLAASRIAFSLSIVGFYSGYLFYQLMGVELTALHYSYIGFNFVLVAIAIGGFFLIPSWRTYLLVLLFTPVVALLNSAIAGLMLNWQLPVYSMPFSLAVLLMLFALRMRALPKHLHLTVVQYSSPEINLYKYLNSVQRFQNKHFTAISLPFFGKWNVEQGHDGAHTHKAEWKHAWDFVIADDEGKTHSQTGLQATDYYGYNKPVVAAADGVVEAVVNHVPDNEIGAVNTQDNWGNRILIRHAEGVYTNTCHLLADSLKVAEGDYVKRGQIIGALGNSGRSPQPHIHFQVQSTPSPESKTQLYPIGYYLRHAAGSVKLKSFSVPEEHDVVSNVELTPLLEEAFGFQQGQLLSYQSTGENATSETWEVGLNVYNQWYFHDRGSDAKAYFRNNGIMFYFLDYQGEQNTLLYRFYLACQRVLLGYYSSIVVDDALSLDALHTGVRKWVQDVVAPFHIYLAAQYQLHYRERDDEFDATEMRLESTISLGSTNQQTYNIQLANGRVEWFEYTDGNQTVKATWNG